MKRRTPVNSEPLPLVLEGRRIYILPTGYGVLFAVVLGAMLLGAINYHNNLAFMLTFLLAGIAMVSILHGYRNLKDVTVARISAAPVFVGRETRFQVRLAAGVRTRQAVRLALDGVIADPVDLPADTETTVEIVIPAIRRGLIEVQRLAVSSLYPLGLFRTWSRLRPRAAGLVYPRPLASPLPMGGQNGSGQGGQSSPHAGTEDFQGLSVYQPGDTPRQIHWKSYARGQGLFTKRFAAVSGSARTLDWFAVPETDPEKKIGILCHAVLSAERQKTAYGLRLPDRLLQPSAGTHHRHRCLQALALMPQPDPSAS